MARTLQGNLHTANGHQISTTEIQDLAQVRPKSFVVSGGPARGAEKHHQHGNPRHPGFATTYTVHSLRPRENVATAEVPTVALGQATTVHHGRARAQPMAEDTADVDDQEGGATVGLMGRVHDLGTNQLEDARERGHCESIPAGVRITSFVIVCFVQNNVAMEAMLATAHSSRDSVSDMDMGDTVVP